MTVPLPTLAVLALIALVIAATFAVARRPRRRRKPGGMQLMAGLLLGLGAPLDPPTRHLVEAMTETPKEGEAAGDPPGEKV